MSERKVLNKYYPPDFDPSKIPRAKANRNRQFTVRLMAPCNMKCFTCGEYIAKAKKFNARKEDVEDQTYLGIRIYRFYIKCPGCLAEISFRTDPESTDYIIEAGAHRNFQALKLAEEQAAREAQEEKEEIESNPMLLLENRTQQSQYEMEIIESLEDLRELSERHAGLDLNSMTNKYQLKSKLNAEQQEEADRLDALKALGYEMIEGKLIKRLANDDDDHLEIGQSISKRQKIDVNPSDVLINSNEKRPSLKSKFSGLVKIKSKDSNNLQTANVSKPVVNKPSGLSLLGSYSDSESSSNDGT